MSRSAIRAGKKEEEGMHSYVFPSNHYTWQSPAALEIADGKQSVNSLVCFARAHNFCFPYETVSLNSWVFFTFTLLIFFTTPEAGEWVAVWGWATYWSYPWLWFLWDRTRSIVFGFVLPRIKKAQTNWSISNRGTSRLPLDWGSWHWRRVWKVGVFILEMKTGNLTALYN